MHKYLLTVNFFTDLTSPGKHFKKTDTPEELKGILKVIRLHSCLYAYTSLCLVNEGGAVVRTYFAGGELTESAIDSFFDL
jgi:hypothetical protein